MGVSEKHHIEAGLVDSVDANPRWVLAGIAVRATQLRAINTKRRQKSSGNNNNKKETEPTTRQLRRSSSNKEEQEDDEEEQECCTTPTGRDARIPERLPCPAAPMKRRSKPASTCHLFGAGGGAVREFFNPPDLESVFVRRHV